MGVSVAQAEIAEYLAIPIDESLQIHLEFDGYNGQVIKQADVVLLGFPLMYSMTSEMRRNDLVYYSARTDSNVSVCLLVSSLSAPLALDMFFLPYALPFVTTPHPSPTLSNQGPAMTWSMYSIAWLELGDQEKANNLFRQGFSNCQKPFGVWTETPKGGTTNFITGAGGFLQSVFAGFAGWRVGPQRLSFSPQLPDTVNKLTLRQVPFALLPVPFQRLLSSVEVLDFAPQLMSYPLPLLAQLWAYNHRLTLSYTSSTMTLLCTPPAGGGGHCSLHILLPTQQPTQCQNLVAASSLTLPTQPFQVALGSCQSTHNGNSPPSSPPP